MILRKFAVTALMLGVAGILTTIGTVQAATASASESMKTWDPDHDGTVDLTEAKTAAGLRFDSLDGDHDGTLDKKEMRSTKIDKKTFAKADPDKDGTLTKDEYLTIVVVRFQSADPDKDGSVSVTEFETKSGQALARMLK